MIYVLPVILNGTGVRTGDPPWHLGWTQQLLHGLPVPVGPAPEIARNSYPWGLHGMLASLTRLVPGSGPLAGLEALHVITVLGLPLTGACLARRLDPRAGWLGAAATGLIGGFGWLSSESAAFITTPTEFRYGADLVVASPNAVYGMLPPALPREIGLILLGTAACASIVAIRRVDRRIAVVAGVVAGCAGLVNLPMLIGALVWLGAATLAAPAGSRRKLGLAMLVPALVVMLPWAGKVVVNYVRFGGFLSTSPSLGVEWPLRTALWSWGILLFLSVLGIVLAVVLRPSGGRTMLALLAGSIVLLGLAIARGAQDWDLWGNATLFHQGRIWPPLHLLGGAFAGYGLTLLFVWLRERVRVGAFVLVAAIVAFGVISPIVAARGFSRILEADAEGFVYGSPDYADGSFAQRVASHLGPDDTVQVIAEGGAAERQLAFSLFSFSGVRLAGYNDPRLAGNDLRIRYADLAREYDERSANDDFEVDFAVVLIEEATEEPLETGTFAGREWALVRR